MTKTEIKEILKAHKDKSVTGVFPCRGGALLEKTISRTGVLRAWKHVDQIDVSGATATTDWRRNSVVVRFK